MLKQCLHFLYLEVGVGLPGLRGAVLRRSIRSQPFLHQRADVWRLGGQLALGCTLTGRALSSLILEGHRAHGEASGLRPGQGVRPRGGRLQIHSVGPGALLLR